MVVNTPGLAVPGSPSGPCVLWTMSLTPAGYGKKWHNGRLWLAHRLAYETEVGPIPEGLVLDHLCRNPACVNVEHLEPVTTRENILRGVSLMAANARKTHCPQGHPYDKTNVRIQRRPGATSRTCKTCDRDAHRRRRAQGRSA